MLKRVMIGLFAISVVTMLWTEANAQDEAIAIDCPFGWAYCFDLGGSSLCGCFNEGSIIAVANITCRTKNDAQCIKVPVDIVVDLFGKVPITKKVNDKKRASNCDFNPDCGIRGTLHCDDEDIPNTILFPPGTVPPKDLDPTFNVAHVPLPLTGRATMDCTPGLGGGLGGFCTTAFEIDVHNCGDNAANCCPDCCPSTRKHISFSQDTGEKGRGHRKRRGTQNISFTPDSPKGTVGGGFDARSSYRNATTGIEIIKIETAGCNLMGPEEGETPMISKCDAAECDASEAACTPSSVDSCVTTSPGTRPE